MTANPRRNFLRLACLAWWIVILIAGLWPFNFFPENQVVWLGKQNGVRFEGFGEIYSRERWPALSTAGDDSFSLELWVWGEPNYNTFSPILSFYDGSGNDRGHDGRSRSANFAIAQSLTDLVVEARVRDAEADAGGGRHSQNRRLFLNDAFGEGKLRFLTVTSGPQGIAIYLEGMAQGSYPGPAVAAENLSGTLLLGHGADGQTRWRGDVLGLAFYPRALTAAEAAAHYQVWRNDRWDALTGAGGAVYSFDEHGGSLVRARGGEFPDLEIPSTFRLLHPRVLEFPSPLRRSDLQDAAVNILGFVPFGFLLAASLRAEYPEGRAFLIAVIIGGATSLAIELLQVYLPSRDSSALDLLNNALGSGLGAILELRFFSSSTFAW